MRTLFFSIALIMFLGGCAPWISGGGDYVYKKYSNGQLEIEVAVNSTREIKDAEITFSPDGTATVKIEGMSSGEDNIAKSLELLGILAGVPTP